MIKDEKSPPSKAAFTGPRVDRKHEIFRRYSPPESRPHIVTCFQDDAKFKAYPSVVAAGNFMALGMREL